tara:strand:+ start:1063 stop:1221 length:159 start_codon:yes stop_codon:yes gene_type:complete
MLVGSHAVVYLTICAIEDNTIRTFDSQAVERIVGAVRGVRGVDAQLWWWVVG